MSDPFPIQNWIDELSVVNKVHPTLQKNRTYVDQNPVAISAYLFLLVFFSLEKLSKFFFFLTCLKD